VDPQTYNSIFTMHGITIAALSAIPIVVGS